MKFQDFSIHASPFISEAYCRDRECRAGLVEVSNGWLSVALFCPKCESVYELKLIKVTPSKVSQDFLTQAREEVSVLERRKSDAAKRVSSPNSSASDGDGTAEQSTPTGEQKS